MSDMVKVSDLVREFFEQKKVEHVFLLSGGMMMHLLDSVSKSDAIKYICMHHEQCCAMAAEGYARVRNEVGVCYATSGPAATNLVTGVAGSFLDSIPVMYITGQSRTGLTVRGVNVPNLRMMGPFEVDIVSVVKPITKYANFVDNASDILYELEKAYYIAGEGRPGPVLLEIPLDIQGSMVSRQALKRFEAPEQKTADNSQAFATLVAKLKESKRPVILGGHGVRMANEVDTFRELVHELNIPALTTQFANDLLAFDDVCYIGKPGLRGDRAGNFAIQTADLIITIGTSLHITTTGYDLPDFAPDAYKIEIDLDEAVLEKNRSITQLQIKADVSSVLKAIKAGTAGYKVTNGKWVERLKRIKQEFPVINEGHAAANDEINTYHMIEQLSAMLKGDEVIVTDAGSLYYIIGQTFKVKGNEQIVVSGALGSMGYALPAAIGATVGARGRRVVCLTGDGSMQMNAQELRTVSNYKLNCTIIVVNNKGYASIRNTQASFLGGHVAASSEATGVTFPDFGKLADAYSLGFLKVDKMSQLEDTLQQALNYDGPVLLEVVMPDSVTMMPSVTSTRLDNGSFRSNKLHEMSPTRENEPLLDISIVDHEI